MCVLQALNEVPAGGDGGGVGNGRGRDLGSRGGVDSSSYRALLPNLVYEQFQVEVLGMSRAAGQKAIFCLVFSFLISFLAPAVSLAWCVWPSDAYGG